MICKIAVESILAEWDILTSVRNLFVVRIGHGYCYLCFCMNTFNWSFLMGYINLIRYAFFICLLSRKSLSCDGILKWWRSIFIDEEFGLPRQRYCSCVYSRTCKLNSFERKMYKMHCTHSTNSFSGSFFGISTFLVSVTTRFKTGQLINFTW